MKKRFLFIPCLWSLGLALCAQKHDAVHFELGAVFFPENFASARQNPIATPEEFINGFAARYIQFEQVLDKTQRDQLEAEGAKVVAYVPHASYLLLLPAGFDLGKIERLAPRSVAPPQPQWKMARSLREPPYGAWAVHGDYLDLNLQVYPTLSSAAGAELCRKAGVDVLEEGTQNGVLRVRAHREHLQEIAAMPFVQFLELIPPPGEKEDTRGRSLHRANLVDGDAPNSKKYDGTGVRVLIRDDGQLGPHIDLQGRLHNFSPSAPDDGVHGDGVSGIAGGAGNLDPTVKGMAAGADIYISDYVYHFQDTTLGLHLNEGVTITNTSYRDGCNIGYTLATQTVDKQQFENPTLIHVFSAGNENGSDCGYGAGTQWGNITGGHKMSKNGIAAANVDAAMNLANDSSRGPAHDGRLKPDISANGTGQESLDFDNTYQIFGGTSGAAPGISGCLAQLTHAYKSINNAPSAPAALLKAAILNSATDLGNIGPDFKFGWGLVNNWRALGILEQHQWAEGSIDQNATQNHTIQIPANVREAKVMLVWLDPPAATNASRALINDLDVQVFTPAGITILPWKLNSTPAPIYLDAPAGTGRDSLNNVEQVSVPNPSAGQYIIRVKGTEVPLGPQHYYLVWEFVKDEIKVTYPNGGEGLVPGETERIHWNAFGNSGTFTLRYSNNDGQTYQTMTTVNGDRRWYDWTVPNTLSGKVRIAVLRNSQSDTSDASCTISRLPTNIQITKVCLDSLWMDWTRVNDTIPYDVYLLGKKYMEIVGHTTANAFTIPIQNNGDAEWVSVRTSHPNGIAGRRALAVEWPGGLLNCPQNYDLAATEILSPEPTPVVSCSPTTRPVSFRVRNEGLFAVTGASVFYQLNNQPPITEPLPEIPAGGSTDFTFQLPITLDFSGKANLKTWVGFGSDNVIYNDTVSRSIEVSIQVQNQFFTENFESTPSGLPLGWLVDNPDGENTWVNSIVLPSPIIGPDDVEGKSVHFDSYSYGPGKQGEKDYLYLPIINLNGLDNPALNFWYAHQGFSPLYADSLHVEVFPGCDLSATPIVVWGKKDPALLTAGYDINYYYPESGSEWSRVSIDLSSFSTQTLIIRMVHVNGYNNSTYLDNIGIGEYQVSALPFAEFSVADTICLGDTLAYQAAVVPGGASYNWTFGSGVSPTTAVGFGPHEVYYFTVGNKTTQLIVSNILGADTLSKKIFVRNLATANFTLTQNGSSISCSNTSSNADSYLWDFGDGNTSTDANPSHTYAMPGNYPVTLFATNACRTHQKTVTVGVNGLEELAGWLGVRVLPNPTAGDFSVELSSQISSEALLTLFNATGQQVAERKVALTKQTTAQTRFENLQLPKGLYQLRVRVGGKQGVLSIAVQ